MEISELVQNIQFVNWAAAIWAPVALMALDFATGFLGACLRGERSSIKMREGGGHKAAELACIVCALVVDSALMLNIKFVYLVAGYILLMEVVSILENVKKMLGDKTPVIVDHSIDEMLEQLEHGGGHPPDEKNK